MRRLIIATIAAVSNIAFTQFALAADWPRQVPDAYTLPPPPPTSSWTGFYIGGNVGTAASSGSAFAHGFTAGVQAGQNWQSNKAVLGIEADFNRVGTGR
jgi:outer membrane immunogenic protein